jgi:hypothetical protein
MASSAKTSAMVALVLKQVDARWVRHAPFRPGFVVQSFSTAQVVPTMQCLLGSLPAVLILRKTGIHERQNGSERCQERAERRCDATLLEEVTRLKPEGRLEQLSFDLDRRAQARQSALLRLPLNGQVESLGAQVDLSAARDQDILRIENDVLGVCSPVFAIELSNPAANRRSIIRFFEQEPDPCGHIDPGQLGKRRADIPVGNNDREAAQVEPNGLQGQHAIVELGVQADLSERYGSRLNGGGTEKHVGINGAQAIHLQMRIREQLCRVLRRRCFRGEPSGRWCLARIQRAGRLRLAPG